MCHAISVNDIALLKNKTVSNFFWLREIKTEKQTWISNVNMIIIEFPVISWYIQQLIFLYSKYIVIFQVTLVKVGKITQIPNFGKPKNGFDFSSVESAKPLPGFGS